MTTTFHRHWRDVPEGTWRWPNFSPAEIACRGTGKLLVNEPALDKLQAPRDRLGEYQPAQERRLRSARHRHPGDAVVGHHGMRHCDDGVWGRECPANCLRRAETSRSLPVG